MFIFSSPEYSLFSTFHVGHSRYSGRLLVRTVARSSSATQQLCQVFPVEPYPNSSSSLPQREFENECIRWTVFNSGPEWRNRHLGPCIFSMQETINQVRAALCSLITSFSNHYKSLNVLKLPHK